jgi:hypothetical protein
MADPNLEAFYAELDARMAMPDDEDWHNFSEHQHNQYCIVNLSSEPLAYPRLITGSSSGFSELLPSINNQVPRVESPAPTVAMYTLFLLPIETLLLMLSLTGLANARHHQAPNSPCLRKGGKEVPPPFLEGHARQPTLP